MPYTLTDPPTHPSVHTYRDTHGNPISVDAAMYLHTQALAAAVLSALTTDDGLTELRYLSSVRAVRAD